MIKKCAVISNDNTLWELSVKKDLAKSTADLRSAPLRLSWIIVVAWIVYMLCGKIKYILSHWKKIFGPLYRAQYNTILYFYIEQKFSEFNLIFTIILYLEFGQSKFNLLNFLLWFSSKIFSYHVLHFLIPFFSFDNNFFLQIYTSCIFQISFIIMQQVCFF